MWLASDKHIPTEGKYYYLLTSTYLYPLQATTPFRTFSDAFTVFSLLLYLRFVFSKVPDDTIQSLFIAHVLGT